MLLIYPRTSGNSPVEMRTNAFATIWDNVERIDPEVSAFRKLRAAYRHGAVFITMPPFRSFWLVALPGVRTIVDWRDGWSVSMATGYGQTCRRSPLKAFVAKAVEMITIILANEVWTCTPGLLDYHSRNLPDFLRRKIKLIPNGHQIRILPEHFSQRCLNKSVMSAVCTGKLIAYGEKNVRRVVDTLAERYPKSRIEVRVIGAPEECGDGIMRYIRDREYKINIRWQRRKSYSRVIDDIHESDLAIALVRDESFEFGTKIFDYVAAGTPILDVFRNPTFRNYFSGCLDTDYDPEKAFQKATAFHRQARISALLATFGGSRAYG